MFRKRGLLLLTLSLVLGLSAAMVARGWVTEQAAKEKADIATVVAASMAMPFGTKVEERHLKIIEMPKDSAPPGSFAIKEEVIDKVTTQKIVSGEILMKARFVDQGEGSTLAALVAKNMRAFTVRVDDVIGVAGFLLPGNRVDVVSARKEGRRAITDTILRNIEVLAVDQTASTNDNEPVIVRAVTLQVTPDQAETLVKGREEGSIQLTLRNPLEEEEIIEEEIVAPKPKVAIRKTRPRTQPSTVTIIRGTNVSETKVSETKTTS
jgi:pilus assembly protein CpaB